MSLIHEALKKAAAERDIEDHSALSAAPFFRFSVKPLRSFRFLFIGIFFFSILFLLFTLRPLKPIGFRSNAEKFPPALQMPSSSNQDFKDRNSLDNLSDKSESKILKKKEAPRLLEEGVRFYERGDWESANKVFRQLIERTPFSSAAHNNLGLVLRRQGKIKEALDHYHEAVRLNPKYAEAENNLGLAYDQTGSIDQAVTHYRRAIDIKPDISHFHLNYATLLERKGDFAGAKKEYQLFLKLEANPRSEVIPLVRSRLEELDGS
ncbi:MAG: tetratricopeptide repeat protein [Candidatus Manganitrophaceae bacterium]